MLASPMSSLTNNLSEVMRIAEILKNCTGKHNSQFDGQFTAAPLSMPPLQLPSADSVLFNFRSSLPSELLDHCASVLTKLADAARRDYERGYASIQPTRNQEAQKLRQARERIYYDIITCPMQSLLMSARHRITTASLGTRNSTEPRLRTRFRQEYVPLLDQYFQSNAYPSNHERAYLARETKMSDRQIEVWFQNHRSRARREGKVLRRANVSPCVPVLENNAFSDLSGYESESSSSSDQETSFKADMSTQLWASTKTDFDIESPPYAFPTPYAEGRSMDRAKWLGFSTDLWMRKPASASPVPHKALKVDELIMLFTKHLTIQNTTTGRQTRRHGRSSEDDSKRSTQPWYSATTHSPRAPYFALVRTQATSTNKAAFSSKNAATLRFPQVARHHGNSATTPLPQPYARHRPRVSSPSSGSADESSCNELITPPSSPSTLALPQKALPDWIP